MKKINKKDLKDNIISCLLGALMYTIVISLLPTIRVNSVVDIVIFGVCFILGSIIYSLFNKRNN